ncbi:MAG: ankyrin repeat domain-containing protein [Steroidobacteraceae bacterium]
MVKATGRAVNDFKKRFEALTSEVLLKKRALGRELAEDAHLAIEEIFLERNERLPPKPKDTIFVNQKRKSNPFTGVLIVVIGLVISGVIKALIKDVAYSWTGVLLTIAMMVYWLVKWLKSLGLSKEQRRVIKKQEQLAKDGLNELQMASANGDVQRVVDLLNYGADVNSRTITGTTALMYAVRNNHVEVAKKLIDAGIDVEAHSDNKKTAYSIAMRFGHIELAEYIKSKSKFDA